MKNKTKWVTGALAVTAAGTGAQAALVQITLEGYTITAGGGNSINLDLTGDGNNELVYFGSGTNYTSRSSVVTTYKSGQQFRNASFAANFFAATNNGNLFLGRANSSFRAPRSSSSSSSSSFSPAFTSARAYVRGATTVSGVGNSVTGGITVQFIDANLNPFGHTGFLEATAGGIDSTRGVSFNRLVWDDQDPSGAGLAALVLGGGASIQNLGSVQNGVFTPIPEPSSLALLPLGGAGVLARRRKKAV